LLFSAPDNAENVSGIRSKVHHWPFRLLAGNFIHSIRTLETPT